MCQLLIPSAGHVHWPVLPIYLECFGILLVCVVRCNAQVWIHHWEIADPLQIGLVIDLKEGLLASHLMTDYQRIDKLLHMEQLNGNTWPTCFCRGSPARCGHCSQESR
jgi:hypothetical protein